MARDPVPRRGAVPGVQVGLDRGPDLVVVLDVVTLPGPLPGHTAELVAGGPGLVGGEADDGEDVGAQVHLRVQVAPLAGLVDEHGEASGQLDPLAQVRQGPQGVGVGRVQLPGDPGATVAEDGLRAVARPQSVAPAPFEVGRYAPGQGHHPQGVRPARAAGQGLGAVEEPGGSPAGGSASRRRLGGLNGQRRATR